MYEPEFEVNVLLPINGIGDRSFVDIIYVGVEEANQIYKFKVNYITPETISKGSTWIGNIPGYKSSVGSSSLIIIVESEYSYALDALNGNFGGHKILKLGGTSSPKEGLATIVYRRFASSYIGGYLSAKSIPGCRAMTIAAFDAPFLKEFIEGFKLGVLDAGGKVNPTAFLSKGFEGFSMVDYANTFTNTFLEGNDLIFALAAGSNLGIINAVRNYRDKRFAMGVDADQSWMGNKVVTGSVLTAFEKDILEYISLYSEGKFSSGNFVRTIEDDRTKFYINKLVLSGVEITQALIQTAILKEKEYFRNNP
jgi:basic membrane lipoprotein Med (substrate-binding protein (PBP1-ABC) superfamily)